MIERKVLTSYKEATWEHDLERLLNDGWHLMANTLKLGARPTDRNFVILERNKAEPNITVSPVPATKVGIAFSGNCGKVTNYPAAIKQAIREFPNYKTTQKIACIKRLRDLCSGLGLAEAKAAVENVEKALECWQKHKAPLKYTY